MYTDYTLTLWSPAAVTRAPPDDMFGRQRVASLFLFFTALHLLFMFPPAELIPLRLTAGVRSLKRTQPNTRKEDSPC